ncbi:MAG TPA: hypothetical protein VGL53_09655 [Bryobacteraceae bacterium]|jgi:hypothetical protein
MKASLPFSSTPEFAAFKATMGKVLRMSKAELDKAVKASKEASPRKNDPKSPGRKRVKG